MTDNIEVKCAKCDTLLAMVDPRQRFTDKVTPKNLLCSWCHAEVSALKYKIQRMESYIAMDEDTEEVCVKVIDINSKPNRAIIIKFPYDALYEVAEGMVIPSESIKGVLKND